MSARAPLRVAFQEAGQIPIRPFAVILFGLSAALFLLARSSRQPVHPLPHLVADVNSAPREVFLALPRLGPARVSALLAEREQAPFQSPVELDRRVRGVGPATVAALRPYLRFPSDTTSARESPPAP